jgi:hypothetical protein
MKKRIINTSIPAEWSGVEEARQQSSFSKASLYKLLKDSNGEIETALVFGRRLINLKSLSAYLSRLSKEQIAVAHHQSTRESLEAICEG